MSTLQSTATVLSAPGSRRNRRRVIIIAAVLLSAIAAAAATWTMRGHRPPAPTGDPVTIARFTATADFTKMSLEQKAQYLQTLRSNMPSLVAAARAGQITREEQLTAMRNGIKAGAEVEMHNHFSLPEGPARKAHLDMLINEQEQMRTYAAQSKQARPGGPLKFDSGVELKTFVESLPPGDRVQMAQFGLAMFKRRQERGLPLWPYSQ
jgi:hypothetical protein